MRSGRVCGVSQLFIIRAAVVQLLVRSALRLENLHTIIISQLGRLGSTAPNVNAVGLKWRASGPLTYGAIHFGRRSAWLGPHAADASGRQPTIGGGTDGHRMNHRVPRALMGRRSSMMLTRFGSAAAVGDSSVCGGGALPRTRWRRRWVGPSGARPLRRHSPTATPQPIGPPQRCAALTAAAAASVGHPQRRRTPVRRAARVLSQP